MPNTSKLPSWEQLKEENKHDPFDGERSKVELKFTRCNHKNIKAISGTEARCTCGAGFVGSRIVDLVNLLKNRT